MAKDIAVFLDGTWNSRAAVARERAAALREGRDATEADTNVALMFDVCTAACKRYLSGVGGLRDEPETAMARAIWRVESRTVPRDALHGGAFGFGLARQIRLAYAFLCANYVHGDRIFLFGFSRGAYAARSLAGFVDRIGLLLQGKEQFVDSAFLLYQMGYLGRESSFKNFLREIGAQPGESDSLPIWFIGVWDTVAALGLPARWKLDRATRRFNAYHRVELPRNVTHARHALALHELRGEFRPVLWHARTGAHQTLVQALFRGAHADVGGGYVDFYWSDHPLRWMHGEAAAAGLPLNAVVFPPKPAPAPPIHCESRGKWLAAGAWNRIPEFEACAEPLVVHSSALDTPFDYDRDLRKRVKRELLAVEAWLPSAIAMRGWGQVA